MTERVQQVEAVNSNGVQTETTRTKTDTPATTNSASSVLARIIWFAAGVVTVLLAIRFVFVLLGANPSNGFANFIYTVLHPFAAPFFGIFSYHIHYGVSRVEVASLVAIVIYSLIAWGLVVLVTIRRGVASTTS